MAEKKFGELPGVVTVDGDDLIPARQSKSGGGYETRSMRADAIKAYVRDGLSASDVGARPAGDVPWGEVSGKPDFGTAALADDVDFANAAQGAKADSAVQPGALGDLAAKDRVSVGDISATGTAGSGTYLRGDGAWVPVSGGGGGDMLAATYDPGGVNADAFDMGNMSENATAKIMTADERSKLATVEAGAQVNAVLSVNARTGAVTLTAADVGARADDWMPGWGDVTGKPAEIAAGTTKADARNAVDAIALADVVSYTSPVKQVTQAQYDALNPPDPGTVYVVVG